MRPNKFQIVKINNALMDYECKRLIDLYEEQKMEFINQFFDFDIEYINHRVEDIVHEMTNYPISKQESIYITKSASVGQIEPNRADSWEDGSDLTKDYGNRVFTCMIFLTEGEIFFPKINLRHKAKVGDGLIWNNVIESGRILDSINQVSNDTYYIKKWVRDNNLQ